MPIDDDMMADADLMAAVSRAAIITLGKELHGAHDDGDPHKRKLRAAAVEICRLHGVLDVLRAVSADGELRPPPPWPKADIVPVGGGPTFLDVEIRTFKSGVGIRRVPVRLAVKGKPTQDQIGEAYSRGYWLLQKLLK